MPLFRADSVQQLLTHLRNANKNAKRPRQRFHDLRDTCVSLLLAQGGHRRVVMEVLGHSNITRTMNTYSHVMPDLQREAAKWTQFSRVPTRS